MGGLSMQVCRVGLNSWLGLWHEMLYWCLDAENTCSTWAACPCSCVSRFCSCFGSFGQEGYWCMGGRECRCAARLRRGCVALQSRDICWQLDGLRPDVLPQGLDICMSARAAADRANVYAHGGSAFMARLQ